MASGNPLYPGYCPGTPQIRRPQGGGPPKPYYDPTALQKILELEIDTAIEPIVGVPRWFKERLVEDLKSSLKKFVSPAGEDYSGAAAQQLAAMYSAGELEEMPGVSGIEFNFNPVDWITSPSKQITNFARDAAKNVFNWDDFQQRRENEFWENLLHGKPAQSRIDSWFRGMAVGEAPTLSLRGYGVVTKRQKDDFFGNKYIQTADVYEEAAQGFIDAMAGAKSVISRGKTYGKWQGKVLTAVREDIGRYLDPKNTDPAIRAVANTLSATEKGALEALTLQADLTNKSAEVMSKLTKVTESVDKVITSGASVADIQSKLGSLSRNVSDAEEIINKINQGGSTGQMVISVEVEKRIKDIEDNINYIKGNILNVDPTTPNFSPKVFRSVVEGQRSSMITGNLFVNKGGGLRAGTVSNLATEVIEKELLNENSAASRAMRKLCMRGPEATRRLAVIANTRRDQEVLIDFLDSVSKGTVLKTHLWTLFIKPRVMAWTPAYTAEKFLEKTFFFGASIPNDAKTFDEGYGFFKNMVKGKGAFKNMVEINGLDSGLNPLFKIKFQGDEMFHVPKAFLGFADKANEIKFIDAIRDSKSKTDLLHFFNGRFAASGVQPGVTATFPNLPEGMPKALVLKFRKFLYEHRAEFGNLTQEGLLFDAKGLLITTGADGEHNFAIIHAFINGIGERERKGYFVSITSKYSGWLEKITQKLNHVQNKVYSRLSPIIGRITYPITVITQRVVDVLTTAIMGALEAVSAGAAVVLAPIVKLIVKFVVAAVARSIARFGSSIGKAILKFDFSEIFEPAAEARERSLKTTVILLSIPLLLVGLIFFIVFGGMSAILSTISPTDPTRGAVAIDIDGGVISDYEGGSAVDIDCFTFVDSTSTITIGGSTYHLKAWDQNQVSGVFASAIAALQSRSGAYLGKLCAAGSITLLRASDTPGNCAHVSASDEIVYTDQCSYSTQTYVDYLFAHETGHVYDGRNADIYGLFESYVYGEPKIPTYSLSCGGGQSVSEDFAETIGVNIGVNNDCAPAYTLNWANHPKHLEFARNYF